MYVQAPSDDAPLPPSISFSATLAIKLNLDSCQETSRRAKRVSLQDCLEKVTSVESMMLQSEKKACAVRFANRLSHRVSTCVLVPGTEHEQYFYVDATNFLGMRSRRPEKARCREAWLFCWRCPRDRLCLISRGLALLFGRRYSFLCRRRCARTTHGTAVAARSSDRSVDRRRCVRAYL